MKPEEHLDSIVKGYFERGEISYNCPCHNNCCEKPELYTPEHECKEEICEECYVLECKNCEQNCCHEL